MKKTEKNKIYKNIKTQTNKKTKTGHKQTKTKTNRKND